MLLGPVEVGKEVTQKSGPALALLMPSGEGESMAVPRPSGCRSNIPGQTALIFASHQRSNYPGDLKTNGKLWKERPAWAACSEGSSLCLQHGSPGTNCFGAAEKEGLARKALIQLNLLQSQAETDFLMPGEEWPGATGRLCLGGTGCWVAVGHGGKPVGIQCPQ